MGGRPVRRIARLLSLGLNAAPIAESGGISDLTIQPY